MKIKRSIINITEKNLDDLISCYISAGGFPQKYAYGIEMLDYVGILNDILIYKGKKEYFVCNIPDYLMNIVDDFAVAYEKAKNTPLYDGFEVELRNFLEEVDTDE